MTMLSGWRGFKVDAERVADGIRTLDRVLFDAEAKIPWADSDAAVLSPKALGEACRAVGIKPPPSLSEDDPECEAWERVHGENYPWVGALSQSQREAIGLRVRDKKSGRLKLPGYDALNDLLAAIEPAAYARALTSWLQANAGQLPRSLALDGKSVGNGRCGMIVTLCRHEDGRPVAMAAASGKKEDSEVSEARALLAEPGVNLVNALITADPLHNKEATARVIVEKGGDYLIGTKENTSKRLDAAAHALKNAPFLT